MAQLSKQEFKLSSNLNFDDVISDDILKTRKAFMLHHKTISITKPRVTKNKSSPM